eukprot:g8357.t1 g8357   contig29:336166-338606(-)
MASLRNKRAASLLLLLATASMVSASAASSDVAAAAAERGAVKVAKKQSARRQVLRGHQSQQDRRAQQDGSSSTATSSVNPVRLFRAGPLKKPPPPGGSLPSPGSATALTDFITPRKHKKKCGKTKKGYKKTFVMSKEIYSKIKRHTGDVIDAHSKADSDGDGLLDGKENQIGTDPNNPDSDGDGLSDSQEVFLGTDPLEVDTDGDGVSDYEEVVKGSDPMDGGSTPDVLDEVDDLSDSDGDGLSDYDEIIYHGTDPGNPDSDGDGIQDGAEVDNGLNPLVSDTNAGNADDSGVSPGCNALENDQVYTTDISTKVQFTYEVAIDTTADVTAVANAMEINTAKYVGQELIHCEMVRKLEAITTTVHRKLASQVDGIDPSPQDIVTENTCSYYTADNAATPANTNCYVIQGFMTLYLREDSVQTSHLESSNAALKSLLVAFNVNDPSPFLEVDGGDGNGGGNPDADVSGAISGNESVATDVKDPLSPLGIALISVGSVALIALALVASTKKRKQVRQRSYAEFDEDNADDLDKDWAGDIDADTDVDASSLGGTPSPSFKKTRLAHVYGEEDSVFSSGLSLTTDIIRDLHATEAAVKRYGGNVDVHHCTSAMCTTCNNVNNSSGRDRHRGGPVFVQTYDDEGSEAITADQGFEYSYNQTPTAVYTPKKDLRSPTFENPAVIGQLPERNRRVYVVDDTVEF